MRIAVVSVALVLAACASHAGVTPNGRGGYLIAKQAATGFPGLGNLKAEAMSEADGYCRSQRTPILACVRKRNAAPLRDGQLPASRNRI